MKLHKAAHILQVKIDSLCIPADQRHAIESTYRSSSSSRWEYSNSKEDQEQAFVKISELGHNKNSRSLEYQNVYYLGSSEGSQAHSISMVWFITIAQNSWFISSSKCGYDTHSRQLAEQNKGQNCKEDGWKRRVPFPFTGCLAHVEVLEGANNSISRIACIQNIIQPVAPQFLSIFLQCLCTNVSTKSHWNSFAMEPGKISTHCL